MSPLQFTRNVRSLNRLRQIASVLTQHGFGHVVSRLHMARFVPVWILRKGRVDRTRDGGTPLGRRLAEVAAELGPTFVKLGQMLTTRPDLIPESIIAGLRTLQDDVAPFDTESARAIVREQLGGDIEDHFLSFGEHPIASGSIGQVYRAKTKGGAAVMVKVLRPGIEATIELDVQLLKWLAESLERLVPEVEVYRPVMVVQEFERTLAREMDYINEASATALIGEAFRDRPEIRIPRVFWELTGPRVLTLGQVEGESVERVLNGDTSGDAHFDRKLVARRLAEAYFDQVFEIGVFHADLHPGNILVDPPATVGLIDFGQTGTVADEMMTQIIVMVFAGIGKEVEVVVDTLAEMNALSPSTDRRELSRAMRTLLNKYYGLPLKRFEIGTLVSEFADVVRSHGVVLPREAVLLAKALGMVTGVAMRLDPDLDALELIKPRLQRTLRNRLSPPRLARTAVVTGWHLLSILRTAPSNLREGLRRLAAGQWQLNVEHKNIDRLAAELDRSSNRLSVAVVIAAIIVGSSIVVSVDPEQTLWGIPLQGFGIVGYLVAGVFGMGLTWAIYRSGRLH
jgi:ubiquinone biosynthesis protein